MHDKYLGIPGSVIIAVILTFIGLAVDLRFGNFWAWIPVPRKKSGQVSFVAQWRRPSTILLVLLIGYTVYTRSINRLSEMAIVAFFLLRATEYDAYTVEDIRESDIDKARDEVLGADPAPRDKHWYDDDE